MSNNVVWVLTGIFSLLSVGLWIAWEKNNSNRWFQTIGVACSLASINLALVFWGQVLWGVPLKPWHGCMLIILMISMDLYITRVYTKKVRERRGSQ